MTAESVPAGQASDGFFTVKFVPTIANTAAPTAVECNAAGAKFLTYSIEAGGYIHTVTINQIKTSRLTLPQVIQSDGTIEDALSIKYAYTNTAGDVVRLILPTGQAGYIVERWALANATTWVVADMVDVIPIKASVALKDAPVANQELTRTQVLNVTAPVMRDVALA
jgi:hypothetical protein